MSPVRTRNGERERRAAKSRAGIARPTALKGRQSNGVLHAGSVAPVGGRNGFPDQVEESLGKGSGDRGAGAAGRGQPQDQRRGRPPARGGPGAGRRHRCRDRARRRSGTAGRRAGHGKGQYRPGRLCNHQRFDAAARRHREEQQPGDRQSAQVRRRHSRPHQLPGVLLSLVHHQPHSWRHQKPARSRHHAGRLVRRRGGGGRGRHRPHRARH